MPLKDPEARRAYNRKYQNQWYRDNPDKHKAIKRKYRQKLKAWLRAYKAKHGCARCREADPVCLCFHHRDPAAKEFSLGRAELLSGMARMKREVAKCDVLCMNCHAKIHAEDKAV